MVKKERSSKKVAEIRKLKRLYMCGDLIGFRVETAPKEIASMRKPRLKNDGEGFYHVTSRCVDGSFRFNENDKIRIVDQMKRMSRFCGMEIGTYCNVESLPHLTPCPASEGTHGRRARGAVLCVLVCICLR